MKSLMCSLVVVLLLALASSILAVTVSEAGRACYYSSEYGGWKDWGALADWEILEEAPGRVVISYNSADSGTKEYNCVATYL